MMRMILGLLMVLIACSSVALAAPKKTDNTGAKEAAKAEWRLGNTAYNLGHYDEAIQHYEAAYKQVPDAAFLFNIAQSFRQWGKPESALDRYRAFLRTSTPDDPNREIALKLVEDLKEEIKRKPEASSEAAAPVAEPRREPEAAVSPAAMSAPSVQPPMPSALASPPATTLPAQASPPPESGGWWLGRKWTWVAGGAAVLFSGGAAVIGGLAQSRLSDLKKSCGKDNPARPGCSEGDISALQTRMTEANVLWGLAGAAVVTAGVLFFVEGRKVAVAPLAGDTTGLLARVEF